MLLKVRNVRRAFWEVNVCEMEGEGGTGLHAALDLVYPRIPPAAALGAQGA